MKKYFVCPLDSLDWQKYESECREWDKPFIVVQTNGLFADITWNLAWLGISCYDEEQKQLSEIGTLVSQLFDRCRDRKSFQHVGHDLGYFQRIRIDYAERVATELFEIFMS